LEEVVRIDIISILGETLDAFSRKDYSSLKNISNHTIHNASIFQDNNSVSIAVIIYSLFKIINRDAESKISVLENITHIIGSLSAARQALERNDEQEYSELVREMLKNIAKTDDQMKLYVEEVITQAEIKKGSKIYEHGISIAQAAEVLGISQWELMPYVGKTMTCEYECEPGSIMKRVEYAREIFGIQQRTANSNNLRND